MTVPPTKASPQQPAVPLPHRPRLADHAMLRRHIVDGKERIAVHHPERSEMLELEPHQLQQIMACDGTRDIGGVVLACVQQDVYRRLSSLTALLGELQQRGLLADGLAPAGQPVSSFPERPLEVLPGYRLRCEQNGSCCTTYSSVPFTTADTRRASSAIPGSLTQTLGDEDGEVTRERLFLPLYGNKPGGLHGVTMIDGRCAFLQDDNACAIHAKHGDFSAKPRGCRMFPATFVDDGQSVRVATKVECACVLSSIGQDGGEPLVPEGAACEADLLPGCRVARLPAAIAVNHERDQTPAELRAWSDALLAVLDDPGQGKEGQPLDALACLWTLGDTVAEHGLNPQAAVAALTEPEPPSAGAMALRLMSLAATTAERRETCAAWRSERDRTRRLSVWLDDAAQALVEQPQVTRLLQAPVHPQHERFYLRAILFGHQLVNPPLTLVQSLRDCATRLLLARKASECIPKTCSDDPSAGYPITAVEAMMRGQGLAAYAAGLP